MEAPPSSEPQSRHIVAKLTTIIAIPGFAAINSLHQFAEAGVALREASLPFLAGSLLGGATLLGLIAFGMGALARRHKKSRFWPTVAWVSVAVGFLSLAGSYFG